MDEKDEIRMAYVESEPGRKICPSCVAGKHEADEASVPFCSDPQCDCVCAG